ncbi:hypothetical protein GCM10025784_09110 [Citricoccus nitrophenolicus]
MRRDLCRVPPLTPPPLRAQGQHMGEQPGIHGREFLTVRPCRAEVGDPVLLGKGPGGCRHP